MIDMKTKLLFTIFIVVLILAGCSSPSSELKIYTISEIKHIAENGEIVKSQGKLIERIEKRKFLVTDGEETIIINLKNFKKESKILDKEDKIIFSGKTVKSVFKSPEIEVTIFKKVEEFK